MKTLNELIEEYTHHLQQGKIQIAYKGILEFLGKLRAEFIKKHPHYDTSSIYQGYMDMSYFSLMNREILKYGFLLGTGILQKVTHLYLTVTFLLMWTFFMILIIRMLSLNAYWHPHQILRINLRWLMLSIKVLKNS